MSGRRFGGLVAASAALTCCGVALAKAPEFSPPRIRQAPGNISKCTAELAKGLGRVKRFPVELSVAANGETKYYAFPESSPEWMEDLSSCALDQLDFAAGTIEGKALDWDARLWIALADARADAPRELAIASVGPLETEPRHQSNRRRFTCDHDDAEAGDLTNYVVTLTVLPDGRVTNVRTAAGSEAWPEDLAYCLLRTVTFLPATKEGIPVPADTTYPVTLTDLVGKITKPALTSSVVDQEAAYNACFPPDMFSMTSAIYGIEISADGAVTDAKVVKGTGNDRLDEAGICILKRLHFLPLKVSDRARSSSVTLELPLRPAR